MTPLSPMPLPLRLQSTGEVRMVRKQSCQGALTQKRTLWGGGAPQVGDLRLLEDGGERGGALVSDRVAFETASERWSGDGERVGVSKGIDRKADTVGGGGVLERGHGAPLERLAQLGDALGGVGAVALRIKTAEMVVRQAAKRWGVAVSMGADKKVNTQERRRT